MPAFAPTFREYMALLKKGNFPSVNILMGEESYYLDVLASAFENMVVDEADRDFNHHVFFGNDVDLDLMVATARQFPVMAERKLVILKEAQSMERAKANIDKLASYISNPSKSTVFVIVYKGENLNATSQFMKTAAKSGATVFKSPKVLDYHLPGPVKDYCAMKGVGIDDRAVALLCEYIGGPLTKLFGEIDRLIVAKGNDKGRITPADIERNTGISKDFNRFEFVSAVANKDYPKTVRIMLYFESNPKSNPTVLTLTSLFKFFSQLLIANAMKDKTDNSLLKRFEIKSVYSPLFKDLRAGLRNYSFRQTAFAIHAMRDFDVKSKGVGSMQNEHELMKELIFDIFTRQ